MGRSSRHKENHEKGSMVSKDDHNEGTAARTRPFSYDEIILRRKVKLPDNEKHEPAIQTQGDVILEKAPDRYRSERGNGHKKDMGMSDTKFSSENHLVVVERSKRKDRDTHKDDYIAKAADRDIRDMESMLVAKKNKDIRMSDIKFLPEDRPVVERSKRKNRDTHKDDYIAKAADRDIRDVESMSVATKHKDIRMSDLKFSSDDRPVVERSKRKDRDTHKDDYIAKAADRDIRDVESMSVATKHKDIRLSDLKFSSGDRPLVDRSKRKDRDTYKHDYIAKVADRAIRDEESMSVAKKNKDTITEPESRVGKNTDGRENSDKHHSNESRNEHVRKQPRIMSEIHRDVDRNREKYDKENEERYRNGVDEKSRNRNMLEERSTGKGHGAQVSEQRERRELLKSNYEELKPIKRRRSRSKERNDRRRRSVSRSPRSHRHAANDGKGHGELSSQVLDQRKLRRDHSESNHGRSPRNVSSSDYKKHGASVSGLGGYSPRKRRTVPTDKTPSPPKYSPEKRRAKWDIAPKEVVATNSKQSDLLISNNDKSASSDVLELVSSIQAATSVKLLPNFLSNVVPTIHNVSVDSVQLTQATRPARRLYLENIPTSASEKAVMEWLNHLMISSGVNLVQGTQPCISCSVHKAKGQAIVELLTPEDASAALSLDGSLFSGSTISIRRPKDFVGMATGEVEKSAAETVAIGDIVADSPNKIFIGGISKVLSAKMVMEIASAFGSLKAFQFEKSHGHENQHAFLEYTDHSVTLKACSGLNGMKLGGQVITAIQATPSLLSLDNREDPPFCGIPEHAKPLLESPTSFLVLRNVFTREDLPSLDNSQVEEVVEDVRLECARFGTVKMVNVVKHGDCAIPCNQSNGDLISAGDEAKLAADETDGKAETVEEAVDADDKSEANVTEDEPDQRQGERGMVPEVPLFESTVHRQHGDSNGNLATTDVKETNEGAELTAGEGLGAEGCREEFKESVFDAVDAVNNAGQTTDLVNKSTSSEDPGEASIERSVEEGNNVGQVSDPGNVFEPGSVFVEFARAEAACMAAHSLHGRLFDGRTVTVEYVSQGIYRARFPS